MTNFQAPNAPYNSRAITSFVLSLVGLITGLSILGIPGVILGRLARRDLFSSGERGAGFAKAGVIIGWIDIVILILVLVGLIFLVPALVNAGNVTADCITNSTAPGCVTSN